MPTIDYRHTTTLSKLVTIVLPAAWEEDLLGKLDAIGVVGWTVVRASGRGANGVRPSRLRGGGLAEWHGPNVQVEIVIDASHLEQVFDVLDSRRELYGALAAWIADVVAWPGSGRRA